MTIPDTASGQFRQFSNGDRRIGPVQHHPTRRRRRCRALQLAQHARRLDHRARPSHQEERFAITVGQAHFTPAGEHRIVGPGETLVVPVGVRHSESNPGAVAVEGVVELRPALHTREMFEALGGLGSEGKTTPRGAPKNPLQLGATCWYFRHESRATAPPIWIQNLILPLLAALAKLFGVRPYHDRWDTRNNPRQQPAA